MSREGDCDPRYLRYVNSRNQRFKNYEFVKDRPSSKVGRSLTADGKVDTTAERSFYRRSSSRGRSRSRSRSRSRGRRRSASGGRRIRSASRRRRGRRRSTARTGSGNASSRQLNLDDFVRRTPARVSGPSPRSRRRALPASQRRIDDYFGGSGGGSSAAGRSSTDTQLVSSDPVLTGLSSSSSDDDQLYGEDLPLSYRYRSRQRRRRRRINSSSSSSDDNDHDDNVAQGNASSSLVSAAPVVRSVEHIRPDDQSDLARQVRGLRVVDLARFEPLNPENRNNPRS